jgi:CheY-like chemotaxis protein
VSPPPATKPTPAREKPKRLRVLVVDDNEDAAAMVEMLLKLSGHEVQTVNDGLAALDAAQTFKPDAVLLDIGMPGMDGYEIARRLRELPAGQLARLIALTGYTQSHHVAAARAAGFDQHLTKPVDIETLRRALEQDAHSASS